MNLTYHQVHLSLLAILLFLNETQANSNLVAILIRTCIDPNLQGTGLKFLSFKFNSSRFKMGEGELKFISFSVHGWGQRQPFLFIGAFGFLSHFSKVVYRYS